jgi:hypothetical protein
LVIWNGAIKNSTFLYKAEYELLIKLFSEPNSVLHPFTILPLAGQFILLIACFQKIPAKKLTYWGIGLLGVLLGFIFIIGIISFNTKIFLYTFLGNCNLYHKIS